MTTKKRKRVARKVRRMVGTRLQWEKRAAKLPRDTGWFVGRTDLYLYFTRDCGYVHYAYPPNDGQRVQFRGTPVTALRKAVLYAEKMNRANDRRSVSGERKETNEVVARQRIRRLSVRDVQACLFQRRG
jgi:hypothetical protein